MAFTKETSEYMWELAFHNERPWFEEHKAQYQRVLKEPFDALAKDTLKEMELRFPQYDWQVHISRIYRDARRLFGRGPYKDHLWFSLWTDGTKIDAPCFWFSLYASSYAFGAGCWDMKAEQLEKYRAAIDANPAFIERLDAEIKETTPFILGGEDYKKPKAEREGVIAEWYNKRQLYCECKKDFGGELLKENFASLLAGHLAKLMPYYEFLYQFKEKSE